MNNTILSIIEYFRQPSYNQTYYQLFTLKQKRGLER